MIDLWGSAVPSWFGAIASAGTVAIAAIAANYARRAAHWTRMQADAAADHVEIARNELEEAEKQTRAALESARRAAAEFGVIVRRQDETRVDAQMPIIMARATLLPLSIRDDTQNSSAMWKPVSEKLELTLNQPMAFRTTVSIEFRNVSNNPACIDVTDPVHGTLDILQGRSIVVPPHDSRSVEWSRNVPVFSSMTEEQMNEPNVCLFRLEFWARDLGMTARDTYRFNGNLGYFGRDGSRLIVTPEPVHPWREDIAIPILNRSYERLDLEAEQQSGHLQLN